MAESRKCRRKGWSCHDGSTNEEFADSPRLRGQSDGDISISSSSSPLSLPLLSLFRPVRWKKRSRPSSFHEVSSQVALRRNDTMTLPAVTCEWPSRVLCRSIARDTWTPLGLPSSLPPRGHPEGILDLASIARRGDSVDTITSSISCYGRPMVDSRMDTMIPHLEFFQRCFTNFSYRVFLLAIA